MVLDTLRCMFNRPSSKDWNSFVVAAQNGKVDGVEEFLNKYPIAVDKKGFMGNTALIFAVEAEVDRCENSRGGDYNAQYVAEKSKRFKATVELLLKRGASINAQNDKKMTSLDYTNAKSDFSGDDIDNILQGDKAFLIKNGAKTGAEIQAPMCKKVRSLVTLDSRSKNSGGGA